MPPKKVSDGPPLQLNASTIDLLLRNSPTQFTEEELTALASLDLCPPSSDVVARWAEEQGESSDRPVGGHLPSQQSLPDPSSPSTSGKMEVKVENDPRPAASSAALIFQRTAKLKESEGRLPPATVSRSPLRSSSMLDDDTTRLDSAALTILSKQDLVGGPEAVAEAILRMRYVESIGRQLTSTATVECFLNATHLYLQENQLRDLEGLQLLSHLQVLVVHHNQVESIRSIVTLDELTFLDVSHNCIKELHPKRDIPYAALEYLNFVGNPCYQSVQRTLDAYRAAIIDACPKLRVLDEEDVIRSSSSSTDERTPWEEAPEVLSEASSPIGGSSSVTFEPSSHALSATKSVPLAQVSALSSKDTGRSRRSRLRSSVEEGRRQARAASDAASVTYSKSAQPSQPTDPLVTGVEVVTEKLLEQHAVLTRTRRLMLESEPHNNYLADVRRLHQKLYEDLNYANEVVSNRMRRAVDTQWKPVAQVLQTRQALVQERQRRIRAVPCERSKAYGEALTLLAEESKCNELDRYRRPVGLVEVHPENTTIENPCTAPPRDA